MGGGELDDDLWSPDDETASQPRPSFGVGVWEAIDWMAEDAMEDAAIPHAGGDDGDAQLTKASPHEAPGEGGHV